jgi:hypothetical protein
MLCHTKSWAGKDQFKLAAQFLVVHLPRYVISLLEMKQLRMKIPIKRKNSNLFKRND